MKNIFNLTPEDSLSDYIKGISGTCEATRFEVYTLHNQFSDKCKVVQELSGFGFYISNSIVEDEIRYQFLSFQKRSFDGHWVLFWEVTSQFADHIAIDEWFKINIPDLPKSDPINFDSLILTMKMNAKNDQ